MVKANCSTLQVINIQHATTVCHAGQQWYGRQTITQESNNNQVWHEGVQLPETDSTKFCQQSDQVGPAFTSQAFTRWRHQSEVA